MEEGNKVGVAEGKGVGVVDGCKEAEGERVGALVGRSTCVVE
jgi:hypothetical protein